MTENKAFASKTGRNSAIELLRIVAMLFIVASHSSVHGCFPKRDSDFFLNNYMLDWLVLGNLGADIFVMISGYYLCTKKFNVHSILKVLSQVWFYSFFCLGICLLRGKTFTLRELLIVFFPTIFQEYWFFTAYIVLLLLSPYINILMENTSRRQLQNCLSIMLVLWCVIPSFTHQSMYGKELSQFLMLYLLGAYLRKYPDSILRSTAIRYGLMLPAFVLLFTSSVVLRFINNIFPLQISEIYFYSRTSILIIACAVGMFSVAIYQKPWTNNTINTIASCTFGVYLFHDNPFIRSMLWPKWINNAIFYDSWYLIIRIILSVILVFGVGILIELFRKKTIEKPLIVFTERIYEEIRKFCLSMVNVIESILNRQEENKR